MEGYRCLFFIFFILAFFQISALSAEPHKAYSDSPRGVRARSSRLSLYDKEALDNTELR